MANMQLIPVVLALWLCNSQLIPLVTEFVPNGFTVTIRAGDAESYFTGTQ